MTNNPKKLEPIEKIYIDVRLRQLDIDADRLKVSDPEYTEALIEELKNSLLDITDKLNEAIEVINHLQSKLDEKK